MEDILLTILFWFMTIMLFAIKYIVPLLVFVAGILLFIDNRKKIGVFLMAAGMLFEIVSILAQVMSF